MMTTTAQPSTPDKIQVEGGELTVQPINHATLVLNYLGKHIYVDPVGGPQAFTGVADPYIILITDIHGDHFSLATLDSLNTTNTTVIVPRAVADRIPPSFKKHQLITLENGETTSVGDIAVQAIPMYNLPEAPDSRHIKGRGNGYILTLGGKTIYISGDTEDIPEMRGLTNVDVAFVCMNMPYTMSAEQAADAVLAFKPKIVYPYHHRGQDITKFKALVNQGNPLIDVRLRDWYPQ